MVIILVSGSGITISRGKRMGSKLAVGLQWMEARIAAAFAIAHFLRSHILLVALAGAWEAQGTRLEPKTGQTVC